MQPNSLTDLHNAYVAGILDGEGSISIVATNKGTLDLRINVANSNKELLSVLQSCYGGSVFLHRKSDSNHKPVWRWQLSGNATRVVFDDVRPYCIVKRRRVLLGLAFLETPKEESEKRAKITAALRFLNRKGPTRSLGG